MPVALVTGAAQGMGRAIALRLADDGYDVAVNDIAPKFAELNTLVDDVRTKGRKSLAVPADVSSAEEVEAAVQTTVKELGGLYCMVANAGIFYASPFEELTPEKFNQIISVNLMGVFNCYKAAAKAMIAAGHGGRLIGEPGVAAYSSSKFAIRGLTQSVAREYGKYGITVNCFCPGMTDTPMMRALKEQDADYVKQWSAALPIPRLGEVEDIANAVSFLASERSGYITGQSLLVDGGERCS